MRLKSLKQVEQGQVHNRQIGPFVKARNEEESTPVWGFLHQEARDWADSRFRNPVRRCPPPCNKRLAALNKEPFCFTCQKKTVPKKLRGERTDLVRDRQLSRHPQYCPCSPCARRRILG